MKRLIEKGGARQAGGFDWSKYFSGSAAERASLLPAALEHLLQQPDGKKRFLDAMRGLSLAFGLAVTRPISRKKPPKPCWNRRKRLQQSGQAAFNRRCKEFTSGLTQNLV